MRSCASSSFVPTPRRRSGGPDTGRPRALAAAGAILVSLLATPSPSSLHAQGAVGACTIDRITPDLSTGTPGEHFGSAVAISGTTIAIGVAGADPAGTDSGAVEIHTIDPTGASTTFQQILVPLSLDAGDALGSSLAIDGSRCLAGAPKTDTAGADTGNARLFERNANTGLWTEVEILVATDAQPGDEFGTAVALSGEVALVGAPREDSAGSEAGAAYIYRRDPNSGVWLQEQKIVATDTATGDRFGTSVALEGDLAVIGATGPGFGAGAVYVYRYQPLLSTWAFEQKLTPAGQGLLDQFAHALALSSGRILASSLRDDDSGPDSGSCATFVIDDISGLWVQEQQILSPDAAAGDFFGFSVALSEDRAVIGAIGDDPEGVGSGAAYLFRHDPIAGWVFVSELFDEPEGLPSDAFGNAVALSGDHAVVGGELHDGLVGTDSGVVRVFLGGVVDCNGNGVSDLCDLLEGTSLDLNGNEIPDECDFVAPVTLLACTVEGKDVTVSWTAGEPYDTVEVSLDGDVPLLFPGGNTTATLLDLAPGFHTIAVTGVSDFIRSAAELCTVTVLPATPSNLVCLVGDPCLLDASISWGSADLAADSIEIAIDGSDTVSLAATATGLNLVLGAGLREVCVRTRLEAIDPRSGTATILESAPACCTVVVVGVPLTPVQDLTCSVNPSNCTATLTWALGSEYTQLELLIDGVSTQILGGNEVSTVVAIPAGVTVEACLRATTICAVETADTCCSIACGPEFVRGDSNADDSIDIGDPINTLAYLFTGGTVTCEATIDANGDGLPDISDVVYTLEYLFVSGPAPLAPFPNCGSSATPLTCDSYAPCE